MATILPSQRLVYLRCIHGYIQAHGYAPSVRDIGAAQSVGVATVMHYLKALERDGLITSTRNVARSLALTQKGLEILNTETA